MRAKQWNWKDFLFGFPWKRADSCLAYALNTLLKRSSWTQTTENDGEYWSWTSFEPISGEASLKNTTREESLKRENTYSFYGSILSDGNLTTFSLVPIARCSQLNWLLFLCFEIIACLWNNQQIHFKLELIWWTKVDNCRFVSNKLKREIDKHKIGLEWNLCTNYLAYSIVFG